MHVECQPKFSSTPREKLRVILLLLFKLEPRLTRIIAVGTITKALKAVFGESVVHLRYFIHMRDNIR